MRKPSFSKQAAYLAIAVSLMGASTLFADDATSNESVALEIKALKSRIADLEQKENSNWLTTERTEQIRAIVQGVLADSKTRGKISPANDTFGYDNGFFIQSSDKNFRLNVDGYSQFRYTFASDQVQNAAAFGKNQPKNGDANGFDFRYGRLFFSGNAFTPNLTYMIMGDFAGDSGNNNDFQLVDNYVAYRFNDAFNIRAGSYLVPFTRLEYISSGLGLIDFPLISLPFDPVRSFGVSLYGEPVKNRVTYEVMVNNGPASNHNGRASQVGGATDNRMGFGSRWQFFGGTGKPSDFADESDIRKDTSTLAWMIGTAAGYDSINQSSSAFPGRQGGNTVIAAGSNDSPGFVSYPVNGDLYRATLDGEIKYSGWELMGAAFFEQINENPGAGVTLPAGYAHKSSFFQTSYYGQAGYMMTPKWEVVGRAGEFFTEGGPNRMDEFTLGLNYFMFGKNVKLQGDVTFIPNEAALTNSTFGTSQNTQDLVTRIQLQLKF